MKLSAGNDALNDFLNGGYEEDIMTTIYGPAGAGKTLLCLMALIQASMKNKVIYVDTEGGFSVERLKQLSPDYKKILSKVIFLKPTSFKEQNKMFEKLKEIVNSNISLIIVDTISMLYRLELGKSEEVYETNRELGKQLSYLVEIARKKTIPVLITNQVYANFGEKNKVNMVGGDLLKYSAKCIIELQITPNNKRRIVLKKHRSIAEEKEMLFKIVENGIETIKEKKGFNLF